MSIKKDSVNITYDALWFKIFMDSDEPSFYNEEVYLTEGFSGKIDLLMQMIGNVGGFARNNNFDKDIDVIVFSDKMLEDLSNGIKNPFIQQLEDAINSSNTPYRKLRLAKEELVIDYFYSRAKSRLNQDKKDTKSKKLSPAAKQFLAESVEEDKVMLDMVNKYRESSKIIDADKTLF